MFIKMHCNCQKTVNQLKYYAYLKKAEKETKMKLKETKVFKMLQTNFNCYMELMFNIIFMLLVG